MTTMYPNFDPASVFRSPIVSGYCRTFFAGKAYAWVLAEDADGQLSSRITDPVALADRVDAGGGTAEENVQRRAILTYYVRPQAAAASVAQRR